MQHSVYAVGRYDRMLISTTTNDKQVDGQTSEENVMIDLSTMNRKELVAHAATLGLTEIKSKATKDEILALIAEKTAELPASADDVKKSIRNLRKADPKHEKSAETNRVIRAGKNLSGNVPYARKYYYLNNDVAEVILEARKKAPNQVRLMFKYMTTAGITSEKKAATGPDIAGGAINTGMLVTKLDPAVLFAYYRRAMETLGLVFAFYGVRGDDSVEEDEDSAEEDEGEEGSTEE